MTDPLPLQLLQQYTREFPDAWRLMASMYRERGEGVLPSWPDWCYCPGEIRKRGLNYED